MEQAAAFCIVFYTPIYPEAWRVILGTVITAAIVRTAATTPRLASPILHALNAAAACLLVSTTNPPLAVACAAAGVVFTAAAATDLP